MGSALGYVFGGILIPKSRGHVSASPSFATTSQSGPTSNCVRALPQLRPTLRPHGLCPARLLSPWGFPGKNTGVGCHFPLQGIFLTRIEPTSHVSPALVGGFFTIGPPGEVISI